MAARKKLKLFLNLQTRINFSKVLNNVFVKIKQNNLETSEI
jgi:hypothetical protein